jgi:hypothetical protein
MPVVTTIGHDPARIDIDVTPGEPVDLTVPVLDATGAAQPLAGWTLSATVRRDPNAPVLHTFTTAAVAPVGVPGDVGYDPGGVRITATGVATELWSEWLVPSARWTLWLTPPADEPYLFAAGWVRLTTH